MFNIYLTMVSETLTEAPHSTVAEFSLKELGERGCLSLDEAYTLIDLGLAPIETIRSLVANNPMALEVLDSRHIFITKFQPLVS